VEALKSRVKLKLGTLGWKLRRGAATTLSDFGDPVTAATRFAFCLYDGTGLRMTARTPAGSLCGTRPCWTAIGTKGFTLNNPLGDPEGLAKIQLVAGSDGSTKLTISGKGNFLATAQLPLPEPVRAQLVGTNGRCWETTIGRVLRNDATLFLGRGE